jgi:hypothetical protein
MSYDGLLEYAVQLAGEFPTPRMLDLWKTQTDANKKEYPEAFDGYNYDEVLNHYGKEALSDQACTICDLNAYLLMVIAAGVQRIETMKLSIRQGAKNAGKIVRAFDLPNGGGKDCAYCLGKSEGKTFVDAVDRWSKLEGNGAVQLKFNPGKPGAHTFVIERVPLKNPNNNAQSEPRFRVYQAYEGIYRLADFLRIPIVDRQADDTKTFLRRTLKRRFGEADILQKKNKDTVSKLMVHLEKVVDDAMVPFDDAARGIGGGRALTWNQLMLDVISPLERLLGGKLEIDDYTALTGVAKHPDYTVPHASDWMIVLMCDTVLPGNFEENFESLKGKQVSEAITAYVPLPT